MSQGGGDSQPKKKIYNSDIKAIKNKTLFENLIPINYYGNVKISSINDYFCIKLNKILIR